MIEKNILPIPMVTSGASDYVPHLTCYLPEKADELMPAVVIFAGGGYKVVSQYEAAPVAQKYAERGMVAFTVTYSCMPAVFPQSLCEGLWVIRYVRQNADKFGIDPNNITAMGFSAGGHLVASLGTLWKIPELEQYLGTDREDCRPDKLVLCYPVISNEGGHHEDSFLNLLGSTVKDESLRKLTCLEHHISDRTPPVFIWHGFSDRIVPAEGSVRFVSALIEHKVYTEFHLYPFADHGGGLCKNAYQGDWSDKAEIFMKNKRLCTASL